jgi:hypothetical protein
MSLNCVLLSRRIVDKQAARAHFRNRYYYRVQISHRTRMPKIWSTVFSTLVSIIAAPAVLSHKHIPPKLAERRKSWWYKLRQPYRKQRINADCVSFSSSESDPVRLVPSTKFVKGNPWNTRSIRYSHGMVTTVMRLHEIRSRCHEYHHQSRNPTWTEFGVVNIIRGSCLIPYSLPRGWGCWENNSADRKKFTLLYTK